MNLQTLDWFIVVSVAVLMLPVSAACGAKAHNVARGCAVRFDTPPNYALCTDKDDPLQLTDGEHCLPGQSIWTQKGCVGWRNQTPVFFTLDLARVEPISGVSYSTAAGFAGVTWPVTIVIFVSDDNKAWRLVGDLVQLSASQPPPLGTYSAFTYVTHVLATRGRYVKLAVTAEPGPFVFTDEVEVYAGPESLLEAEPEGEVITDAADYMRSTKLTRSVQARLAADIAYVREALAESKVAEPLRKQLTERLDQDERKTLSVGSIDAATFKAILPMNDAHADVFSVYSRVIRSRGLPEFFAWKKHRYDPLDRFELPDRAPGSVELSITMMRREFRSDAFLLTNASEKPVRVRMMIRGLPGAPKPAWLAVSSMPWTDTWNHVPVAAALPEAAYEDGGYRIDIPSGMTRKVWLTVDSSKLGAGSYAGYCSVEHPDGELKVPFKLRVSSVAMGKPRLSLGMWDYTDVKKYSGIDDGNKAAAIGMMRSHFVDSPWAQRSSLPWPKAEDFDSSNRLKAALDFSALDKWVGMWPGAKHYMVFAAVGDSFAGEKIGTDAFHQRVGNWAKGIASHLKAVGLKPGQLAMLLVDEPHEEGMDDIIAAWAKAVKDSTPEILVFTDPIWPRPDLTKNQDAILKADIICPNLGVFCREAQEARDYYTRLRSRGKTLWFYSCSGPVKTFDPDRYYRMQAWYAFRYRATGMGFWAFGDTGGCVSSWDEYTCSHASYTPAFIGPKSVTDGIHWQAVREGIEDYEYLAMLRDVARAASDQALKDAANELLTEIEDWVKPEEHAPYEWSRTADRDAADRYRLKALALLESARTFPKTVDATDRQTSP